jgi:hypothetical protein
MTPSDAAPSTNGGEIAQQYAEALANYQVALYGAWVPTDLLERLAEAYQEMSSSTGRVPPSRQTQRRLARTRRAYADAMQDAVDPESIRLRAVDAYRDYVEEIRRASSELDPDIVDINTLAAMGQTILQAAWLSSLALAAMNQRSADTATGTGVANPVTGQAE